MFILYTYKSMYVANFTQLSTKQIHSKYKEVSFFIENKMCINF